VCSGNMVRSAFAHLYAEHVGLPIAVRSAATTYRNDALYPETARALLERGVGRDVVVGFRPFHLDDSAPDAWSGWVALGMTRAHAGACERRRDLAGSTFLLGGVTGVGEIADPVLEGADFELTFRHVARCVDGLRERLQRG